LHRNGHQLQPERHSAGYANTPERQLIDDVKLAGDAARRPS
jgi:hypothetical protein